MFPATREAQTGKPNVAGHRIKVLQLKKNCLVVKTCLIFFRNFNNKVDSVFKTTGQFSNGNLEEEMKINWSIQRKPRGLS